MQVTVKKNNEKNEDYCKRRENKDHVQQWNIKNILNENILRRVMGPKRIIRLASIWEETAV